MANQELSPEQKAYIKEPKYWRGVVIGVIGLAIGAASISGVAHETEDVLPYFGMIASLSATSLAAGIVGETAGKRSRRKFELSPNDRAKVMRVFEENTSHLIGKHPLIVGTGVGQDVLNDEKQETFHITLYLKREANEEESSQLPEKIRGVPVSYLVTGEIKPAVIEGQV